MMKSFRAFLLLTATLCVLYLQCQGIQFSFDRISLLSPGTRTPCGTLTCVEVSQGMTSASSSNSSDSPVAAVTRIDVYKTHHDQAEGKSGQREMTLLVTVGGNQKGITWVKNTVRVEVTMGAGDNTVYVELLKPEDCRADFTCEVFAVDAKGRELVRTSQLLRQPTPASDMACEEGVTTTQITRILGLVERLSTNMDQMKSAVDGYSERLNAVEGLDTKFTRFQRNFRKNLGSLEKNITNKLVSVKKDLQKKLTPNRRVNGRPFRTACRYKGSVLERKVKGHLKELEKSIRENAAETRLVFDKAVDDIKNATEAAVAAEGEPLKSCMRGILSPPTRPPYPYPVVKPSDRGTLIDPFLCDTVTDGGGWIVIQRRTTGNVDFYRTWQEYKDGFGTLDDDFWLGNENIHHLTTTGWNELRIELKYNGRSAYEQCQNFKIAHEKRQYALILGSCDGTAGDSIHYYNKSGFSTRDRNNRFGRSENFAVTYTSAWWYPIRSEKHDSTLNGKWGEDDFRGPHWLSFSRGEPVTFTEMKIRKRVEPKAPTCTREIENIAGL